MQFRQTPEGKNVFISIDSRLSDPFIEMPLSDITEQMDERLSQFSEPRMFDESIVRKKLKEYVSHGLLVSKKKGKVMYYHRANEISLPDIDVLDYFSEVPDCVIPQKMGIIKS